MNTKLLKNIIKAMKNNQNSPLFSKLLDKYNLPAFTDNLAKQNLQYNRLSDKGRLIFNAKAAQDNVDLLKSGRTLDNFSNLVEYELDRKIPLNELSDIDMKFLEDKALDAYKNSRLDYEDYFDSHNEGIEYYLNEFIKEKTGVDLQARKLNNNLRQLSKNQLNQYVEDNYGQFFDKPNKLSLEQLDGSEPYDNYLIRLLEQEKIIDDLEATGGFNEPVKIIK